ncbi:SDR family oxidoreductase [Leifsonia shinshuensis]|uniref:Nucleoside-diphosphate-sugar epimerase n=1 Tax=Leifsonia shinshuensis TaxID=150026 RepID=A0A853CXI1_9MICO|nr:SDR family oxidoreductase [Leifsonia shinshuensis]NYJ25218.1 nucleoside-diphosphate-sugar epimerase [Leifsonia shinshuensis]
MRIFVTGGSGWIGSAVIPELVAHGHSVLALARSDASAAAVEAGGAEALRGDLVDTGLLRSATAESEAVIHLAYRHDLGQAGGAEADARAIEAFTETAAGSGTRILVTGATISVPGRAATEEDELVPAGPVAARTANLRNALAAARSGAPVSLVMIPRTVHGTGERHGFIPQLIARARATGVSAYVGDGSNRWPAVHIADAATLYRLAVESAPAGSVLNAVGEEGVRVRDIAETIGRRLGIPAEPRPAAELGMPLGAVLAGDMPASSALTRRLLGWTPTHPGLLEDIGLGHYFE